MCVRYGINIMCAGAWTLVQFALFSEPRSRLLMHFEWPSRSRLKDLLVCAWVLKGTSSPPRTDSMQVMPPMLKTQVNTRNCLVFCFFRDCTWDCLCENSCEHCCEHSCESSCSASASLSFAQLLSRVYPFGIDRWASVRVNVCTYVLHRPSHATVALIFLHTCVSHKYNVL